MHRAHQAVFLLIVLLALTGFVHADLGPKPSATINVTFEGQKIIEPFEAKMLGCYPQEEVVSETKYEADLPSYFNITEFDEVRGCYWHPADLAWGGNCTDSQCGFTYFMPEEFRLAVFLPSQKKVFVSKAIARQNFDSTYDMDIPASGMASLVETTHSLQQVNVVALLASVVITLVMELAGTLFFFWRVRLPFNQKLLMLVGAANLISLPVVWFGFPRLGLQALPNLLLSEAFAVLFEAAFLFYLARPLLTKKRALLLSLLNNALSIFVGGMLFVLLAMALNWPIY